MRVAVLLVEDRDTKYGVRAALAALESRVSGIAVHLARGLEAGLEEAKRLLDAGYYVLLGVSLMSTMIPDAMSTLARYAELRDASRGRVILAAGGPHASVDPYGTLTSLRFDVAFIGGAEVSLPEAVTRLLEKWSLESLLSVRGVAVRLGGEVLYTGRSRVASLDEYPPFPWWRRLFTPIEVTRGCPWGCRYCATWFIHGAREVHRSVESILKYAEVQLTHGLRDLRFVTPNSFSYGERARGSPNIDALAEMVYALSELASKYKARLFIGSFPSEVRPDYVTEETLEVIKGRVANRSLVIGAQSGSERVLKAVNRGHSVDDVISAVELAVEYGFRPDVDFIFGLPGEEESDVEETLDLIDKLVAMGARIHAHTFMPLPGTPLEDAPPGRIHPLVIKRLRRHLGRGRVYGYWLEQEELAAKLVELRRRRIIYGLRGWRLMRYTQPSH